MLTRLGQLRNFYSGAWYYGLAYTLFISLEFAIHDMLIEYIAEFTGSKDASLLNFLRLLESDDEKVDNKDSIEVDTNTAASKQSNYSHWHNELLSSFTAGCIAAFLTNGIETVAVNKQANPKLSLADILFNAGPKRSPMSPSAIKFKKYQLSSQFIAQNASSLISVMLKGWQERTIYYGVQASFFFLYLNHLTAYLGVDTDQVESQIDEE